jgi:hypothetical protein
MRLGKHTYGTPTIRSIVTIVVALALLSAGCSSGSDGEPADAAAAAAGAGDGDGNGAAAEPASAVAPGTWAGRVDDSDAFVAVVVGEDQIAAYVCEDGVIGSWFFGPAPGGETVALANAAGHRLEVDLGDEATGSFDDGTTRRPFRAQPTGDEVLFRAEALTADAALVGGWVRLGDEVRGTISTGSTLQPAPPLGPEIEMDPAFQATLVPTPMTPDTLGNPTSNTTKFVWAAGGDSFASGEGNPERGRTNGQTTDDYEDFSGLRWGDDTNAWIPMSGASLAQDMTMCHRSDRAGAPKANAQLPGLYPGITFKFGFVACGGAQTVHMIQDGYLGPDATPASLMGHAKVAQPAQLTRINTFKANNGGRLDALYMSIGGNDMGFGPIVTDCVSPVGSSDCGEEWTPLLAASGAGLASKYAQVETGIVSRFTNNTPVLISLYPNPVHDTTPIDGNGVNVCFDDDYREHGEVSLGGLDDFLEDNVTRDEAIFAFGVSSTINQHVEAAAAAHGWRVVRGHVGASAGHGLCADNPHFNLNSAAVRRQGRDIPNSSVFVVSSGLMHPNDAGFTAYGNAIVTELRPHIDNVVRTGLFAPTNVRVAAATRDANITLRWNDRATAENAYEVQVVPARPSDVARMIYPNGATRLSNGGFVTRVNGIGAQQFVHQVNGPGQFKYRVRACHTAITSGERCGPQSAEIVGTNVAPAAPTGVTVSTSTQIVGGQPRPTTTVRWNAQVDAIEFVVRTERTDGTGTPTDVRTTATSISRNALSVQQRFKVAACNRIGCSTFRNAA